MVLDASSNNTHHYKVRIKGKMKQSREKVAPSPTPIEKGAYRSLSITVANFIAIYIYNFFVVAMREKIIGLLGDLFIRYLFFFNMCFWHFTLSLRSKMVCSCVPFDLYCGDCFNKVVVLFNSRICVSEFLVRVNYQWQIFVPVDVVSLFLFQWKIFFNKSDEGQIDYFEENYCFIHYFSGSGNSQYFSRTLLGIYSVPHKYQNVAQGFLTRRLGEGHSPGTSGSSKDILGPVDIPSGVR